MSLVSATINWAVCCDSALKLKDQALAQTRSQVRRSFFWQMAAEMDTEMMQTTKQYKKDDDNNQDEADLDTLIPYLGPDNSIYCIVHCSRSDYGAIAALNRNFRTLIRSGEIYRLRRRFGIVEHWIYFSVNLLQWEAYDPSRMRWMRLPRMETNECFLFSDKESLAIGTELLVFGKEITSQVIYKYSLLTNSWSSGMSMNTPRCLFASGSLGEIGIIAGGCNFLGKVQSTAELYNSETCEWIPLPDMNKARKMCSGVFMDGKFYVVGGVDQEVNPITSAEVLNLETMTWEEIPNMYPKRVAVEGGPPVWPAAEAPPLLGVVDNELYCACHATQEIRKYNKKSNTWAPVGRLPEQSASANGWGIAFRACGERLMVISGPRDRTGGFIELNSWIPRQGPTEWTLLDRRPLGSFVYNCTVMGC